MGLRVLVCASEVVPFAKTGGLADVAGALPKALAALGHDARVALPRYGSIDLAGVGARPVGEPFTVVMGAEPAQVQVYESGAIPGVPAYLVDCPKYFDRPGLYGQADDVERFALFCRGLLEFLRRGEWQPQVIHANDWQAGLLPVYLRKTYAKDPRMASVATLFTIHNLAYQGVFGADVLYRIGLDESLFTLNGLEFYGQVNLMKGGLEFADLLNTVSETYSKEIQTPEFGERLDGVLAARRADLFGVLNGLDYDEWNPATDPHLAAPYSRDDPRPKAENKAALQRRLGLPVRPETPLLGLVSRLATQKGVDLLAEAMPHLLQLGVQLALLGTGEQEYHDLLSRLAQQHPRQVGLVLGFDNPLAHQIYAGSDLFLMPSRYEPCGLGQMISLRYGTIPVVRHTGGLADTIVDLTQNPERGNGFSFREPTALAFFGALARALLTLGAPQTWQRVVARAMACEFSWQRSAQAYVELYQRALSRRRGR